MTDTTIRKMDFEVCKVDESLGLVFGYAMVCKVDGKDYVDLQDDHIPESTMLEASLDFMKNSRRANDMHTDAEDGSFPFAFPMTTDIAEALDITVRKTGLLVAYHPDTPEMFKQFKDGTRRGFSIEGTVPEGGSHRA